MAGAELDFVRRYGASVGLPLRERTILVEGSTDVEIFELAARLEYENSGVRLLTEDLAVVAAGEKERGGVNGVVRELIALRGIGRSCMLPNGRPRYRFVGLVDNDRAGRGAVKDANRLDASILEYKDIFRLQPVMPAPGNLDPKTVQKAFEKNNQHYNGMDWELEDLLDQGFVDAFLSERPDAVLQNKTVADKVHREWSRDGKAALHRFVRQHATWCDVKDVVNTLSALRLYLGLTNE